MRVVRLEFWRVAVLAIGLALMLLVAAPRPAQAAAQNCFNGTGRSSMGWSTQGTLNYARGAWCMRDPQRPNYRLVWQSDGNLVAYNNASANRAQDAKFSSGTAGRGTRLSFQVDGNLVVYNASGTPLWWSGHSNNRNSRTYFYLYVDRINLIGSGTYEYMFIEQYDPFARLFARRI